MAATLRLMRQFALNDLRLGVRDSFLVFSLAAAPFMSDALSQIENLENGEGVLSLGSIGTIHVGYIAVLTLFSALLAFISALVLNTVARNVMLNNHRMDGNLNPFGFAWVGVSNILLVIVSLGLFFPWAMVRPIRYMANHLTAKVDCDLDGYVTQILDKTGAFGDEMTDAFDIDVGVI